MIGGRGASVHGEQLGVVPHVPVVRAVRVRQAGRAYSQVWIRFMRSWAMAVARVISRASPCSRSPVEWRLIIHGAHEEDHHGHHGLDDGRIRTLDGVTASLLLAALVVKGHGARARRHDERALAVHLRCRQRDAAPTAFTAGCPTPVLPP